MPTRKLVLIVGVVVALVAVALISLDAYYLNWQLTGFGPKTLWDWMGLLLVPLVLAVGGIWFSRQEKRYELQIAEQRAQEAALQAYLDQMTTLLLDQGLRKSEEESEARAVARSRTLTVLRRLDAERKGSVLQFLCESDLINKDKPIVVLDGADLEGAALYGANLQEANLYGADLYGANLQRAYLQRAYLRETNLQEANLVRAVYDSNTKWTDGFDPRARGSIFREGVLEEATEEPTPPRVEQPVESDHQG